MSDDATLALRDARLMLEDFAASPWRHLDVAVGSLRLSISRTSAVERAAWRARATPATPSVDEIVLTAPHVSTLRDLAMEGATIQVGEVYAMLELLDDAVELRADRRMRVVSVRGEPDELLEFGSPLLVVAAL